MHFYSTNHNAPKVALRDAVASGTAPDGGLYMPDEIIPLPLPFFRNISDMAATDIAYVVANTLLGEDLDPETVRETVNEALSFEMPFRKLDEERRISTLELFHGPTMSVKDIGARFMASLLRRLRGQNPEPLHIIAATSGDAGSAVASAFQNMADLQVTILYPKGRLTPVQKAQFTGLGDNVNAIEVRGSFDDCQALVKTASIDPELKDSLRVVTANSINIARFLPQMFHFFNAYARMVEAGANPANIVISVPSGNLGNLAAGLLAKRMGLPVKRFVAATNANDALGRYMATGEFVAQTTVKTHANAMDTGAPTNLPRVMALYEGRPDALHEDLQSVALSDERIIAAIRELNDRYGYVADPHSACAYAALCDCLAPGEEGLFLSTAHPAKCPEVMTEALGYSIPSPSLSPHISGPVKMPLTAAPVFQSIKHILKTISKA